MAYEDFFITFTSFFKKKKFCRTPVRFRGHWHPCFGLLVTSPLGFKASVQSYSHLAEVDED